ncbi:MAG: tRNA preQ1(34) S-adenosylmethionine ribosyltransferase-isomerase QueA, partial [Acidimicrobiia bacterium]|nr:tRNA preQ1(34) S-adenosylmethionine ribosyltransferase-isomerase QueA [Acidimicrobiia bacterium]
EPRDSARLLDTRTMADHRFSELPQLLQPNDLVVINDTRVRRARLRGRRVGTGGEIELLLLNRRAEGNWEALISPARRIRPGVEIAVGPTVATVTNGPTDGIVTVSFEDETDLESIGSVPLPPYITTELEDPERYQTVYARRVGSAAAPTAGLHFTPAVLAGLEAAGIRTATVELQVGLGTFRPIATERIEDHVMHREWCSVPEATAEAIRHARQVGGRVVAIGTTTVRTLETFGAPDGTVGSGQTETDLYLRPGSDIRVVDLLVTNFHVPGSSLLVMLAAFMGDGWRHAYEVALGRRYRFLSFGDAMLCERNT